MKSRSIRRNTQAHFAQHLVEYRFNGASKDAFDERIMQREGNVGSVEIVKTTVRAYGLRRKNQGLQIEVPFWHELEGNKPMA